MAKVDNTADKPKGGERVPESRLRDMDRHRHQVVTMPVELQQQLASLPLPRLSEVEMKPPPPIDELMHGREGRTRRTEPAKSADSVHRTGSAPKRSPLIQLLYFANDYRVPLLTGTAVTLAIVVAFSRALPRPPAMPAEVTQPPVLEADSESPAAQRAVVPVPAASITTPQGDQVRVVASAPAPAVVSASAASVAASQPATNAIETAPKVVSIASVPIDARVPGSSGANEARTPAALGTETRKASVTTTTSGAATTGTMTTTGTTTTTTGTNANGASAHKTQSSQKTAGAASTEQVPTESQNQPKRRRAFRPEGR